MAFRVGIQRSIEGLSHGYSLLEIVFALAISFLVAGVAIPRGQWILDQARLSTAATRVCSLLLQARAGAVHEDQRWVLSLDSGPHESGVLRVMAGGAPRLVLRIPPDVQLQMNAASRIIFNRRGSSENATIFLQNAAGVKRVVINQRGRVRVW